MMAVGPHSSSPTPPRHPHHPGDGAGCGGAHGGAGGVGGMGGVGGGRLNLLLSYSGWESDCWVDHLPRLLEPMGVVSHRAGSAKEASRVIQTTPIHVAVVDLGLPMDSAAKPTCEAEGCGPRLLDILARLEVPPPTVVIKRALTHRDASRETSCRAADGGVRGAGPAASA